VTGDAPQPTTLVVDGANVVGSRPDGWWRDRRGAAVRLRDHLARLADGGVAGLAGPLRLVLVVEGAARGIGAVPGVEVVDAPGSGDDAIVLEVMATAGPVVVATADRGLRTRVLPFAQVIGPTAVWDARP
jgi:hypothetical protein